jgi:hypothetical protein
MSKAADRAARRAEESGSGPVRSDAPPARFPGARSGFGLLGEMLLVGILVSMLSLVVVTLPIALAAGVRHLERYLRAEDSRLSWFWSDVRDGLLGGLVVGVAATVLSLLLALDIAVAATGALPGGELVAVAGWIGLAALVLGLFTAVGRWTPKQGWRGAVRSVPRVIRDDPAGAAYLLATGAFAVIVTWQLFVLAIPALGCVALAIVSIPERARRRRDRAAAEDAE